MAHALCYSDTCFYGWTSFDVFQHHFPFFVNHLFFLYYILPKLNPTYKNYFATFMGLGLFASLNESIQALGTGLNIYNHKLVRIASSVVSILFFSLFFWAGYYHLLQAVYYSWKNQYAHKYIITLYVSLPGTFAVTFYPGWLYAHLKRLKKYYVEYYTNAKND